MGRLQNTKSKSERSHGFPLSAPNWHGGKCPQASSQELRQSKGLNHRDLSFEKHGTAISPAPLGRAGCSLQIHTWKMGCFGWQLFVVFFSKEKGYGSFMKQGCKIESFLFSARREGMGMSLPCRVCKCSPWGWAAQRVPWQKRTHAGMLGRARTAEDRNLSAYPWIKGGLEQESPFSLK